VGIAAMVLELRAASQLIQHGSPVSRREVAHNGFGSRSRRLAIA
jgi:hypothetical protein